jgi:ubiquinone/menaquinone biosynthesis C-methylase UbiE
MEMVLAGQTMHRCRTAFLDQVPTARNILLLGEGHGRALVECRRRFPAAQITCVDASHKMLDQARRNIARHQLSSARIEYLPVDALAWQPPAKNYDLIITNFFFDCFPAEQSKILVEKLAAASTEDANWLVANFQIPTQRLKRLRSQLIVWMLYRFFRIATRLSARALTPPDDFLRASGFKLSRRLENDWGLFRSDWWQRDPQFLSA